MTLFGVNRFNPPSRLELFNMFLPYGLYEGEYFLIVYSLSSSLLRQVARALTLLQPSFVDYPPWSQGEQPLRPGLSLWHSSVLEG